MEKKQSTWSILSAINCNDHTEKKNGLTYLSWVWAWGIVKENFPTANYKVRLYDGRPYLFDENLGYLVTTEVTIDGETIEMSLPVMDGANKAQKNVAYTYKAKDYYTKEYVEKTVSAATMFDINTAIMRCLTKNLAMFGLGHYIYAGEDITQAESAAALAEEKSNDAEILAAVDDYLAKNDKAQDYYKKKYGVKFIALLKGEQMTEIYNELKKNKRI